MSSHGPLPRPPYPGLPTQGFLRAVLLQASHRELVAFLRSMAEPLVEEHTVERLATRVMNEVGRGGHKGRGGRDKGLRRMR